MATNLAEDKFVSEGVEWRQKTGAAVLSSTEPLKANALRPG